jgi:hypothetical protein
MSTRAKYSPVVGVGIVSEVEEVLQEEEFLNPRGLNLARDLHEPVLQRRLDLEAILRLVGTLIWPALKGIGTERQIHTEMGIDNKRRIDSKEDS